MKPRVLLAEPLEPAAEARLDESADVVRPAASDEAALCARLGDCDALVVRTRTRVTRELLAAAPKLRVVGVAGVGLDNVDLPAAEARGIRVVHTPEASSDAVAEFTVGLMLSLLRPFGRLAEAYRAGRFHEARAGGHGVELRGLCVGIVGMGRIGSRVARICAAGFQARVLYNDVADVGPFDFAAERVEKDELYARSDVVTLHVPLTDLTRRLVGAGVLARLKPGAWLVNTARGELVDLPALAEALRGGRLGGAALDVTDPEPAPADHALFGMPNVILTPHAAARTQGGLRRMCAVVDRVLEALRGGE